MNGVLNGLWQAELCVPAEDRGFLLGDGLFETLLAVDGSPRWWQAHWERLERSAAALGFMLPRSEAETLADVHLALEANDLTRGLAAVRLTVTRGRGSRGYWSEDIHSPLLLVTAARYHRRSTPLRAITVAEFPRNERSPLCHHKTTSALELVLAQRTAHQRGADVALLVNTRREWVEASYANLFLVIEGELLTPPLESGVLPGIARAFLQQKLPVREAPIAAEMWAQAQAAFLTNSLMGARSLGWVDGYEMDITNPLVQEAAEILDSIV